VQLDISKRNGKTVYNVLFSSVTDLYNYLKSNPKINKKVFDELSSIKKDKIVYGESLDKSIEYLLGGYNVGFDNFLKSIEILRESSYDYSDSRQLKKGIYGGVPLAPLVASGIPECMLRYDRRKDARVRNIYFSLSYNAQTTTEQIRNRGLIILYIIDALEKNGDIINFKANEISYYESEVVNIEVVLKKSSDLFLNIEKCYFPFVGKEFLRRIMFRVLECLPVTEYGWQHTYGRVLSNSDIKEFLNLKKNDILIPEPRKMGITGYDIYDDTISTINYLNLATEFDTEKIKKLKRNGMN